MKKIYFKYKDHPGDLFRNESIVEMPNVDENPEDFFVWFLPSYQSDRRIALIDDLTKLLNNEFVNEKSNSNFINYYGKKSESEIKQEIELIITELKFEAFKNFYNLLWLNKIEIIA